VRECGTPRETPVFRQLSTQRHGISLSSTNLEGNCFNFAAQSGFATFKEVGTSLATDAINRQPEIGKLKFAGPRFGVSFNKSSLK